MPIKRVRPAKPKKRHDLTIPTGPATVAPELIGIRDALIARATQLLADPKLNAHGLNTASRILRQLAPRPTPAPASSGIAKPLGGAVWLPFGLDGKPNPEPRSDD
jgi:hypothetical protein